MTTDAQRTKDAMSYRMTVVLEYKDEASAPRIGVHTKDFGDFTVYALQFSDALAEVERLIAERDQYKGLAEINAQTVKDQAEAIRELQEEIGVLHLEHL